MVVSCSDRGSTPRSSTKKCTWQILSSAFFVKNLKLIFAIWF